MPARRRATDGPHDDQGHGHKPPRKKTDDHDHDHNGHKPHDPPYHDPDYDHPPEHEYEPPDNPRYPDRRIYGRYASKRPPRYVPHPFEHACFKPRKEDYKPPTTCNGDEDELCVRKDHRTLTVDEQNRFLNAFTQINAMNALGPFVDIHANAIHQMHGNPRFLPWHRVYLVRMEELLMSVDPTVCLPYWKSSEEQAFPSWLLGFTPTVNLIGGPHTVTRNIGVFAVLPNAAAVAAAMANGTFNSFGGALEGIHDSGHVWVDGSMGGFATAPCDPVFWMHHAEIDRIWAEWQEANPGQNPPLAGAAATMDPWTETEADTRDIEAMGYAYA
ncbi:MAG TPA: tyrosinase family protein [Gaiellaceae bacterium]|nr:tyrosinase family protein [Gaiellaceae bacterium]